MKSLWQGTWKLPEFDPLQQDIKTDVLIIGGGLAGILCAFFLKQSGVSCLLTEANRICSKITQNTTAKITSQHGLIYHKLIREFGTEKAGLYLRANEEALQTYTELCQKIDCDFEKKDNFVYSTEHPRKIERELAALEKIGFPAKRADNLPLPFSTVGAVMFPKQAQFHPLKFVSAIAKNLNIHEHTAVRELIGTTAVTDYGKITAEKIIVATHFPFINKHGSYFLKMYQQRSYVIAVEEGLKTDGMYVDESKTGFSFRNYKNLLLLGGGGHRTGKKGGNYEQLENFAKTFCPEASIKYRWAAQDCMTLDNIPYIGRYSKNTSNFYTATGFNKWGMTSSMAAALLLSDLIQEKENPYRDLFSPSRHILRPQLAVNAFEAGVSLLTPTRKRCPHMGCALKWNPAEHSWDCPCHGSRFSEEGKLLDNPATGDF